MSGKKRRSGHPSNERYAQMYKLTEQLLPDAHWRKMIRAVEQQVLKGNLRSYNILREMRFGQLPAQLFEDKPAIEPIRYIEIALELEEDHE
jgi:hypothetical protein